MNALLINAILNLFLSACGSYSIPHHLKEHIDLVTPTLHFDVRVPIPAKGKVRRDVNTDPGEGSGRSVGQPGVGSLPKTTGKVSEILTELEDCDEQITLPCLRALYNIIYKPVATNRNTFAIGER